LRRTTPVQFVVLIVKLERGSGVGGACVKTLGPLYKKCQSVYFASEHIKVDEQLLGFRGRCGFRMCVPNKLVKYGIKT